MAQLWSSLSARWAARTPVRNAGRTRNGSTAAIIGAWRICRWRAGQFASWSLRGDFVVTLSSAGDVFLLSGLIRTCWRRGRGVPPGSIISSTTVAGWFGEGFDMPDLIEAKAVLDELCQ